MAPAAGQISRADSVCHPIGNYGNDGPRITGFHGARLLTLG